MATVSATMETTEVGGAGRRIPATVTRPLWKTRMERQCGVVVGGATEGRGGVVVGGATEGRGGVVVGGATEGRGGVVVGRATEGRGGVVVGGATEGRGGVVVGGAQRERGRREGVLQEENRESRNLQRSNLHQTLRNRCTLKSVYNKSRPQAPPT